MTDVSVAGVTLSGPTLDQDSVETAWGIVQEVCGWHIAPVKEETITVDLLGSDTVNLPSLQVQDVKQVLLHGMDITDQVSWSKSGLLRLRSRQFWCGRSREEEFRALTVTMVHGFEQMPAALRSLVKQRAQSGDTISGRVSAGPFTIEPSNDNADGMIGLTDAAWVVLDRYRLPAVKY